MLILRNRLQKAREHLVVDAFYKSRLCFVMFRFHNCYFATCACATFSREVSGAARGVLARSSLLRRRVRGVYKEKKLIRIEQFDWFKHCAHLLICATC